MTTGLLIVEPGELVSLPQIARLRGVELSTVHRRVRRGRLPAQRIGRQYFVRSTDLESLWPANTDQAHTLQPTTKP